MSDQGAGEPREDRRQQPKPPKTQTMKPETAAKKLGIYLPAAPAEFRDNPVTREQLNELLQSPAEWLIDLRKNGPHPRAEVSRKLGITNSGLARAGQPDVMTTDEIEALRAAPPAWLLEERARHAKAIGRE